MRYIRTEDAILIFSHSKLSPFNGTDICLYCWNSKKEVVVLCSNKDKIVKIGKNIEELCDEFVAIGVPNRTFIIDEKDYKEQGLTLKQYVCLLFAQYENIVIYGAIRTDKGLIYVAKMNDKGELELMEGGQTNE